MVKKKKSTWLYKSFIWLGVFLVVIGWMARVTLPSQDFFREAVCSNGCGYANIGLSGYGLYVGLTVVGIGAVLIVAGALLRWFQRA